MPTEFEPNALVKSNIAGSHNRNVIIVGSYNNVSLASQPGLRLSKLHKLSRAGSIGARQLVAFERGTRFVGRDSEVNSLQSWLDGPRLISVRTIVGPAGIGKTRLAVELADLAESQGWISGFLRANELQRFVGAPGLSDWIWNSPTLIVIDYAAQKADAIGLLLEHLQDVEEDEQALEQKKLRLLLLEREASSGSGWWARAFGPSGQSDRRLELAEPQEPCRITSLSEEDTVALIADSLGQEAKLNPVAVLNACLRTEESRRIVGNPLLVQIATLSSIQKGTTELLFSTDLLLGGIVDRERQLMRSRWREGKIPDAAFQDLEKLVAIVTLVQGSTLEKLSQTLRSASDFSSLVEFLSPERIVQALSCALPFEDADGFRPLEPDIIGDRFIVECNLNAELIQSTFKVDRFSLGPRLWRLLDEYQQDGPLEQRIAGWVRQVISHIEDVLILDVFLSDAPGFISGVAAQVYAEARSKVTEGLRQGEKTQESLLLREDQKADLISRSLFKEGIAHARSGNHEEAIRRYNVAIEELIANNFDETNLLWVEIHSCRAESFQALGQQGEYLSAIDEAIAACKRLIKRRKYQGQVFASEPLKDLLQNIEEHKALSERGLRMVLSFSDEDVRLQLARLVIQQGSVGVGRNAVLEAILHLDELAESDVHSHFCADEKMFREAALRCDRNGAKGYAKVLWKAQSHFQIAAKKFLSDLLGLSLGLRQLLLSSKKDDDVEFGLNQVKTAICCLTTAIAEGVELDVAHLMSMTVVFFLGLPTKPPGELFVQVMELTKDETVRKADLAKKIANDMSSVAEEAGVVGPDFRSSLLKAVAKITF